MAVLKWGDEPAPEWTRTVPPTLVVEFEGSPDQIKARFQGAAREFRNQNR